MPRWLVAMSKLKQTYMKPSRVLREVFEYLIGFIALAVFAGYAFAKGPPTEVRWLAAFKLGTAVGVLELSYLWFISRPANRLILGANLWLCAGGVAAFLEQWWWLKLYEKFGEASLFACILLAGIVSTIGSPSGFVGEIGPKTAVRNTSLILLASVSSGANFSDSLQRRCKSCSRISNYCFILAKQGVTSKSAKR